MRRHRIYKGRHCEQPKHGGCADGREGALDLRGKGRRVALLATVWALSAMLVILLPGLSGFALAGAAGSDADGALTPEAKPPTQQTLDANEQVYALLDFDNTQELDFAQRGLIAAPDSLDIIDADGHVIWSQSAYAFLEGDAPGTVNPSLWRNAQANHFYGLFEVVEGIYQVRGYDISNITFVAGDTGWVVLDPLMSVECAQAALALVNEHLGERPVKAVVISHSHVDHIGGIKGIVSAEEVASGSVAVIAPEGFEEHIVSESVYAGNAMGRRAGYQYGVLLEHGETGTLSVGLGMGQSTGTVSYISPNDIITMTGETRTIDGVKMEFQLTPGTEAPAEMNTWFPDKNALWMAENCTATLHNLYTLRGAQVRDGNAWAGYIMEAISRYGSSAEVVFQSHNWPHWGNDVIVPYMENTAAVYKFINDQTLLYINQGYTANEIADMIKLPEALEQNWYTRQYYGTLIHNAKAVYQRFMGWYDANPVHLNALSPTESARKYVTYLGDPDEVIRKAREDFANGEYQWVAEITNMLVFADPSNQDARYLCADSLEQLAYQAESGAWRNAYLSGAKELREGAVRDPAHKAKSSQDLTAAMTPTMILDYMGILIDSNAAQDINMKINLVLIGKGADRSHYLLTLRSGVLLYQQDAQDPSADATLTCTKAGLYALLTNNRQGIAQIQVDGDASVIDKLTAHLTGFDFFFHIVEP